jgi:hypothetical protein
MTVIDFPTPPRLSEQLGRYRYDPLGFVKFAFPWGKPGSPARADRNPGNARYWKGWAVA